MHCFLSFADSGRSAFMCSVETRVIVIGSEEKEGSDAATQ